MTIHVRRHERTSVKGKAYKVRSHERQGQGGGGQAAPAAPGGWWDGSSDPPPPGDHPEGTFFRQDGDVFAVHPDGSVHQAPSRPDGPSFDRMADEMRHWRALDVHVPRGTVDTSPKGRLLGTDTQEGADRFARLSAYRDAGYTGPLDSDERIPDPDDPGNWEWMSAGAALAETHYETRPDGC